MNDLLQLMHDTMGPTGGIKNAVNLIKGGSLSKDDTTKMLDIILKKTDQLNEALDAYYVKTKGEPLQREVENN